jgi:hypothetical protein
MKLMPLSVKLCGSVSTGHYNDSPAKHCIQYQEGIPMNVFKPTIQILFISLCLPLAAQAESWSCRHDNDVREVHIEQPDSSPVPCEVVYKKLTEGAEDQVLWNAQNDGAYCEEKAKAFVDKLQGWGWTCVETISDQSSTQ